MSENSAKIYFKSFAWFDPSIKSYFLMGFLSGFVEITSFQSRWIVALGTDIQPLFISISKNNF